MPNIVKNTKRITDSAVTVHRIQLTVFIQYLPCFFINRIMDLGWRMVFEESSIYDLFCYTHLGPIHTKIICLKNQRKE